MNPGVGEEGAKVANSVVEALKSQPMTLSLVVFNVVFLLIVYFSARAEGNRIEKLQSKLFDQQNKTMEMLYNCTPNAGDKQQ